MRLMRLVALVWTAFFIFGCHSSQTGMDETELSQVKAPKPSLVMGISLEGSNRNEKSYTLPDENIYDVDDDTIFSLFSDGAVIYSGDEFGGSPYCTFNVTEDQIGTFFNRLKEHGIFEGEQWQSHYGPSSSYVQILFKYNGQVMGYFSWHELFADNPKVVDTDRGIVSLEGRDRDEVIKSRSLEYKEFLHKWSFIRDSVRTFIEENSEVKLYSAYQDSSE